MELSFIVDDIPTRRRCSYPPVTATTPVTSAPAMTPTSLSPNTDIKAVEFVLQGQGVCSSDAKRFQIRPNDTVDSIIDAVKHLFAIDQHCFGVSFETDGLRFIPSYSNFSDGMTVYVVVEEQQGLFSKRPYNLRQFSNEMSAFTSYSSGGRSISPPVGRGLRSNSTSTNGRSRKRFADTQDDYYPEDYYSLPSQQHLPDDDDDEAPRNKLGALASADISLDNIVEGSRRKRPKFSSDELPLFPPPTLPPPQDSPSSISPSHPPYQLSTPYRAFPFTHPTPPSYVNGPTAALSYSNNQQPRPSIAVPTPAPTIASCISDEDVALQLMRLGNANAGSRTASTFEEYQGRDNGSVSEGGEYDDDGRSDTTELPDTLPVTQGNALPDSPILYPRPNKCRKIEGILPSLDALESSDDENQPPEHEHTHATHISQHHRRATGLVTDEEEDADGFDDEADGSYVSKGDSEDDYDDEDDVPLSQRRDRKFSSLQNGSAFRQQHPTKATKPTKLTSLKTKQTLHKSEHITHYPISPASPPASRKASVASSNETKSRPNGIIMNGFAAPLLHDHYIHARDADDQQLLEEPALKPRCQRCRKSKKGCDRQRPCQRCKDAGIPADGCISEDEAGTRRGRQAAAAAKRAGMAGGIAKIKSKPKKKKTV